MMNRQSKPSRRSRAKASPLPPTSRLEHFLPERTYLDSFEATGSNGDIGMMRVYTAVLGRLPRYFRYLMYLRTILVAPFGLKGPSLGDLERPVDPDAVYVEGGEIWRWRIYAIGESEVVTGMNDKHLDFRVSLLRRGATYNISTAVRTHNLLGKIYLAVILPFHRFGVKSLLADAVREGRI